MAEKIATVVALAAALAAALLITTTMEGLIGETADLVAFWVSVSVTILAVGVVHVARRQAASSRKP